MVTIIFRAATNGCMLPIDFVNTHGVGGKNASVTQNQAETTSVNMGFMKFKPVVPISILYSFFLILFSVSCFSESNITNPWGTKFVYIKPGTFMMGSPANDPDRYYDENQHRVTLTKGFFLQTTEVTQSQWEAVMGKNPSKFKGCGQCPVERVSWREVQEFILKLNQREGMNNYRLLDLSWCRDSHQF